MRTLWLYFARFHCVKHRCRSELLRIISICWSKM